MEYSLTYLVVTISVACCLNPYSNGILTDMISQKKKNYQSECLNPYSNGILTDMISQKKKNYQSECLNPYSNGILTDLLCR